ncbi:PREDICTED: cell division cycle protein 123 homolog [Ceratosolen solmsi marchali]|uniref:Cell division cycle protein 123 homolog n=1 Tax=Ceratosolen solmsi marchali TaxID=326594 RepID=A0AAJ6YQB3_9HYME|nr:PREDICTED: cell division cycle protein 123 homolog [Ceratosolen solmsi marchali]
MSSDNVESVTIMKTESLQAMCSFCQWYPLFSKNALEAIVLPVPKNVCDYLEHDAFILPSEATSKITYSNSEWSDGSAVNELEEDSDFQPTFPDFSRRVQEVIDKFEAVFIKSNWSAPTDSTWVTPTKTLKCTSLEDVYLLLKSSDRISQDLSFAKNCNNKENFIAPCLVLKRWQDVDPCTEFRCFIVNGELAGISQRDIFQYYRHIENEKYDIQKDIKSMFMEKVKDKYPANNYTFDVIRYKKDKVKIVDFGLLNKSVTEGTLFTLQELQTDIPEAPEFRFIAEDMGIQPKTTTHLCVPREVNEFFQATGGMSMIDAIQKEVQDQGKEENASIS